MMRIILPGLSKVDQCSRRLSKRGFNSTKQLLFLLSIFVLCHYELAIKPFNRRLARQRRSWRRRTMANMNTDEHAALWSGEKQRNPALELEQVQQIEIALAYCNGDVSWLANELVYYVKKYRMETDQEVPRFKITVLSKCGNEDSIPDFAKDMNEELQLGAGTTSDSRTVNVQVDIIILVNNGGLAHMHYIDYINQYIEKNTAATAENSIVIFLTDSPRTKKFLHESLRWRKISEMIYYASLGEFICGIKNRCTTSVFHDVDVLKKYILANYIRTSTGGGDQTAAAAAAGSGEDFNASKYKNLGDFVEKEFDWSFPDDDLIEVCYGGTFAVPASRFFSDPKLEKDLKRFEQILYTSTANSIAPHFAERLWAAFLANPLNKDDSSTVLRIMDTFAGKNGSYMGTLKSRKMKHCESNLKF